MEHKPMEEDANALSDIMQRMFGQVQKMYDAKLAETKKEDMPKVLEMMKENKIDDLFAAVKTRFDQVKEAKNSMK